MKNKRDKAIADKSSKKKSVTLLYIILGISIAGILIFGSWLGYDLFRDWQSQQFYTAFAADIQTRPRTPTVRPTAPASGADGNFVSGTGGNAGAEADDNKPEEEPDTWLPYMDFDLLAERFPDIRGWIKLDGTPLNYPLMQTTDNDFYLYHLPDRTRHRSGSVFIDYRNSPDFTDRNTIIYGHMSRTDDMFGALRHFRRQAFFDENYIMHIYLPDRDYQVVIFTVYLVDSGDANQIPVIDFRDEEHFMSNLSFIRSRSMVKSDIEVTAEDRLVTLATCQYDFLNARLILVGKLVPF